MADTSIPTRDGQTVGGFVDEVCRAVEARLQLMVSPMMVNDCYVSCERDTVNAGDAVGEIRVYGGECAYYRFRYSRDASFRLVLSEPEPVNEVTTYEPAAPPAVGLARAVLCDMAPVHAPAAEGLTRGRSVQLLRVGPLHDLDTGDHVLDVTDEMCAAIAATASVTGFGLPIDHGHSLYRAQSSGAAHESVPLYGRIVALEHVAGSGLFGVPEWTESGRAMLAASPGLLYLSPTILGQAHDPATGAALPGRALHSVSLTPTPRQNNLETLALSRGTMEAPTMGDPTPRTPAVNPDVLTLSRVEHAALLDRATGAERRVFELTAQLDKAEGDTVTLSARLTALETERATEKARAEIEAARNAGKVVPPDADAKLLAMAPDARTLVLSLIPATRPVSVVGHGGKAPEPRDESDPSVIREAVRLTREKNIDYTAAIKLAANPVGGVQ